MVCYMGGVCVCLCLCVWCAGANVGLQGWHHNNNRVGVHACDSMGKHDIDPFPPHPGKLAVCLGCRGQVHVQGREARRRSSLT